MRVNEYIDRVGEMVCPAIVISHERVYTNYPLYLRWYGYYRLSGSLRDKFKLYRSNADIL